MQLTDTGFVDNSEESPMEKRIVKGTRVFGLLAVVLALTVVGCTTGDTGDTGEDAAEAPFALTDVEWQWESVTQQPTGDTQTVPNPESYTIVFREDSSLSGQADCNHFSGEYTQADGGHFSIAIGPITMAFCGEESLDQQYLVLLGSVAAGGPAGGDGTLALESAGGADRMIFKNGGTASVE